MEPYDYTQDPYHSSKISAHEKSLLPEGFSGICYNMSYKWIGLLPTPDKPLKVMEIGAYHGANACSLVKTFAKHPKSEIHCIDPWTDYEAYPEYKNKQALNYSIFLKNISKLPLEDLNKVYVHRMSSVDIDTRFKDESFDIIYIDGNHTEYFVMHDAILSLKKLVPGGHLVFDDVHDKGVVAGLQAFLTVSREFIEDNVRASHGQAFVQKKLR
jgi:predicted O-methyltransferase YrrM